MRNTQKTKSRAKLYNALNGVNEITTAGEPAVGTIQFSAAATATDVLIINGVYFEFQAGASEAGGTSAGTVGDPHLITHGVDADATAASVAAAIIAETATIGAWGLLHPDRSVAGSSSTDTLTVTYWPGTAGNSTTAFDVSGLTAAPTAVTQPTGGTATPYVNLDYKTNTINVDLGATNLQYIELPDGDTIGQEVTVAVQAIGASDTPTVLGKLYDSAAKVQVQYNTVAEFDKFMWDGTQWVQVKGVGGTYTAAT